MYEKVVSSNRISCDILANRKHFISNCQKKGLIQDLFGGDSILLVMQALSLHNLWYFCPGQCTEHSMLKVKPICFLVFGRWTSRDFSPLLHCCCFCVINIQTNYLFSHQYIEKLKCPVTYKNIKKTGQKRVCTHFLASNVNDYYYCTIPLKKRNAIKLHIQFTTPSKIMLSTARHKSLAPAHYKIFCN